MSTNAAKIIVLAGYVDYLRECIRDGVIDPETLDEWTQNTYECPWAKVGEP